jgi:hypothetical protein
LPGDVAEEAKAVAARVKARLQNAFIESGRDLLAIEANLPRGKFRGWLDAEFG